MDETTIEVPVHYNANQLVTYKVIENGVVSFPTTKVNELEWTLEQARRTTDSKNELQSQINKIIDNLTEDYWYNPNTDKETVLNDICEIIGYTPKKTISFTATMSFTGSIEIDLSDAEDFDLEDVLSEAYVDINNGDVEIDGYELYDASECQYKFLIGGYPKKRPEYVFKLLLKISGTFFGSCQALRTMSILSHIC